MTRNIILSAKKWIQNSFALFLILRNHLKRLICYLIKRVFENKQFCPMVCHIDLDSDQGRKNIDPKTVITELSDTRGVFRGGYVGLVSHPPGPVIFMDFRGFLGPIWCGVPLEKKVAPSWTNSWNTPQTPRRMYLNYLNLFSTVSVAEYKGRRSWIQLFPLLTQLCQEPRQ